MSYMNSTEFTKNFTALTPSNITASTLPSINVLFALLGFQTWQTLVLTLMMPPINLLGAVFCSFSLWIFFRPSFSDPIFFYYKLLCFVNIIHLVHNVLACVPFLPLYFPWVNSFLMSFFSIYYSFLTALFFHFEDVLRMAILLHKMKLFSPFVKKHFSKSPQFVSLSLFIICLFINVPLIFGLEIDSFGDYSYFDSNGVNHTASFYFLNVSQFGLTFFGQTLLAVSTFFLNLFLTLFVGITLNILSYTKYKSHVRKRQREIEELQMSSIHNRPTTSREMLQVNEREKIERRIEKNMFFMALTLSSISVLSRFLFMISYVYYFVFYTFSNSILIGVIGQFVYTFGPTVSIFVFYSFNNTFRNEMNKRLRFCHD
jgi:hypothetical protein